MTKASLEFRKQAADHLRASRKLSWPSYKDHEIQMAASYKNLADNEEWAAGEKRRSKTREPKPKKKT